MKLTHEDWKAACAEADRLGRIAEISAYSAAANLYEGEIAAAQLAAARHHEQYAAYLAANEEAARIAAELDAMLP